MKKKASEIFDTSLENTYNETVSEQKDWEREFENVFTNIPLTKEHYDFIRNIEKSAYERGKGDMLYEVFMDDTATKEARTSERERIRGRVEELKTLMNGNKSGKGIMEKNGYICACLDVIREIPR